MRVDAFKTLLTTPLPVAEQIAILKKLPALDIEAHELAMCAEWALAECFAVPFHQDRIVDLVGTGGDNSHTFNVSTTASFIVAGAGIPIAKHGNRAVTSRSGGFDLLKVLGVVIPETPDAALKQMAAHGITFLFAPFFHPSFKRVMEARQQLAREGYKTLFNFLGPLVNPGHIKRTAIGVFDAGLISVFIHALQLMNFEKAVVFHGNGMDELSLSGSDKMAVLHHGRIHYEEIKPEFLGLLSCEKSDLLGGDPEENARITLAILTGEEQGPKRDVALLNAASAIMVGSDKSLSVSLVAAREALNSGRAYEKLQCLRKK